MPAETPNFSNLAVAGDECDSCRSFWTAQGKPPQRFVAIGQVTTDRQIPIVVCRFCDGEPIVRNNVR